MAPAPHEVFFTTEDPVTDAPQSLLGPQHPMLSLDAPSSAMAPPARKRFFLDDDLWGQWPPAAMLEGWARTCLDEEDMRILAATVLYPPAQPNQDVEFWLIDTSNFVAVGNTPDDQFLLFNENDRKKYRHSNYRLNSSSRPEYWNIKWKTPFTPENPPT